jgi:hypothetical protein
MTLNRQDNEILFGNFSWIFELKKL